MKMSRRQLLRAAAVTGGTAAVVGVPQLLTRQAASAATISADSIPKYVTPLFVLPAMPPSLNQPGRRNQPNGRHQWSIGARQVKQQILPAGFPATTVFAMGSTADPRTFHAPCYTLESQVNELSQVSFRNQLLDSRGNYVPSLLAVDPTLMWANPPGGISGRDSQPTFTSTPSGYTGPVPFVVHMHGAHAYEENDGYPEAWTLPAARNIPKGYATVGSYYDQYRGEAGDRYGVRWPQDGSVYSYENDQRATALWFHDHSLGVTRTNSVSGWQA
jgi:spore coat protein A, manganese oxidase